MMRTPDADHCLKMAAEADRLASIVSYGRDKDRLKSQAEDWRAKASQAASPTPSINETAKAPGDNQGCLSKLRGRASLFLKRPKGRLHVSAGQASERFRFVK